VCGAVWWFVRLAKSDRKPDHGLVLNNIAVVIACDLKHFGRVGMVKSLTEPSDGFDIGLKFPDEPDVYGFPGNDVVPVLESSIARLPQFQEPPDTSVRRLQAPAALKRASRAAAT
jgi:hypothetical protein